MAIAWTGFPFAKLVEFARPLGSAKFVRMETFMNPKIAPGQKQPWYPWPYIEGLTMAEATNELATCGWLAKCRWVYSAIVLPTLSPSCPF